ncbi:uncharacterized protein SPPG_02012 [Spizellomyces punctatus DAOM BR117]|uniref:Uncharacterized protein n=1 Tax=Spizellomyces punctatus (strain DAOM BR117) TaxID=645134 RepID=A0A0L0HPB3_SPIPD|nr:uncharacterized protein SPPG_02012 [Spizellomyces punctatus DAOM BR117]KND02932.1 hypothetical protein SPPG_02012 [Spizellomyces punctatus DAOM BR117]|eukprot:XP_016610971.1 hypothetical protein SPPG_02012 [Spizellomyces punctatus DAOM BR117]
MSLNKHPIPACHWYIEVRDCPDSEWFIAINYLSAVVAITLFIMGNGILFYRCGIKKHRIWNEGFTTLDSYIFVMSNWFGIARFVHCLLLAGNLYPSNTMTLNHFIHDFAWLGGMLSAWTYIFSVVKTTPRHAPNVWLPSDGALRKIRLTTYGIHSSSLIPFAFLCGQAYEKGEWDKFDNYSHGLWGVTSFWCVMLGISYGFFGRQIIRIAGASARDIERALGTRTTASGTEASRSRMKKAIKKMKVINVTWVMIFVWFGIILSLFAVLEDAMISIRWLAIIHCFGTSVSVPSLVVCNFISIIWGEMHPPEVMDPGFSLSKTASMPDTRSGTATIGTLGKHALANMMGTLSNSGTGTMGKSGKGERLGVLQSALLRSQSGTAFGPPAKEKEGGS